MNKIVLPLVLLMLCVSVLAETKPATQPDRPRPGDTKEQVLEKCKRLSSTNKVWVKEKSEDETGSVVEYLVEGTDSRTTVTTFRVRYNQKGIATRVSIYDE